MSKNKSLAAKAMWGKKIIFILILCGLILILVPAVVNAAELTNPLVCRDAKNVVVPCTIPLITGQIIKTVLGIVGSIALLMFIYGGFLWLTSGGSTEKIAKGKQVLVWAVIGLAVIFLSYTLVGFVIKALTGAPTGGSQPTLGTCKCTGGGGYQTQTTEANCPGAIAPSYKPCSWSAK